MSAPEKLQILIIEDDIDYVDIIRLCLDEPDSMNLKFEIEWADRLEVGLKLLETAPFDAVLLDLMLPDSRGMETIEKVTKAGHELPVLVMTNLGDEQMAFEAMRLGAQDYMVKATSDSRLLKRAIWYAIERRKLLTQSEALIKRHPDGMAVISPGGEMLYVNPAADKLLGGRPKAFPLAEGQQRLGERLVEVRFSEIQWKGKFAKLAVMRDITELQRLEQLRAEISERRRLDKLKDDLIGTVSHELRTPLTIVKGAVDNLKEGIAGPLQPKQQQIVGLAHRNVTRLARMINNLLDLSRLESQGASARRQAMDLGALVLDVAEGGEYKERKLDISTQVPEGLPEVLADSEMMAQVLNNLFDNAMRFAKSKITLRAHEVPEGVMVEILDDGPGIPADRIKDMFNKFVQVNRAVGGGGYKGTGLGLAITKEIMSLHGGKIGVDSIPGRETRFWFTLPLAKETAAK